jgi:hypothetical protein
MAARSSALNPLDALPLAVVDFADFCVPFFAGFLSAIVLSSARSDRDDPHVREPSPPGFG